ncbi:winged helix-turn-helix domain-containing protein [Gracilibacillus caseinilyticus]|uniref:Winged helix-turn-helix domain-containing protein n=1 Tax=Gracilibacillus caseinilyticus TaxID=2932256 RepID=A0ABY4ERS8_9BACI|nr:winged helix-turn-helix domain-containing protein [Gracilibacillus caseinilyticus]UOQ46873.1 winged helix-turn-helix domain-containing protein [Gracilibacillus caseinilyticus]
MHLSFQTHNYTVTHAGETVQLLRKEFALLHYLFTNANHSFTRDQLLDAVWQSEAPSDRTVDDHIYRLRKKLNDWKHVITIETVKGYGYRLAIHHTEKTSPFVHDEEFRRLTSDLFNKYHLFGQGEALNILLQQDSLGIEVERDKRASIAFMQGDMWSFIDAGEISFPEKALFLFYIYIIITNQPEKIIPYFEKALRRDVFSSETSDEARILSPITFYILGRDFVKAKEHLHLAYKDVPNDHGFYPFLQLNKMMYHMCLKNSSEVTLIINEMNEFFSEKPYQREFGLFHVLKGLYTVQLGDNEQGKQEIVKGFTIIRQTRFKSHVFLAIRICLFMLEYDIKEPDLFTQCKAEWHTLNKDYNFVDIEVAVEQQIREFV